MVAIVVVLLLDQLPPIISLYLQRALAVQCRDAYL